MLWSTPSRMGAGASDHRLQQEGPQIVVTVSDDGRGLPNDFTLHQNNGLGLQIARTLVEKIWPAP